MTDSGIIGIGNRAPVKGEKSAIKISTQLFDVNKKIDKCQDSDEKIKLTVEAKKLDTGLKSVDRAYF